jgi:hypothetical protein
LLSIFKLGRRALRHAYALGLIRLFQPCTGVLSSQCQHFTGARAGQQHGLQAGRHDGILMARTTVNQAGNCSFSKVSCLTRAFPNAA